MSRNGGRESFGESVTAFGAMAISLRNGTKGGCRHVSTPTLKYVMELDKKKFVRSVVKNYVYLEGEEGSPLYKPALVITVSRLCDI